MFLKKKKWWSSIAPGRMQIKYIAKAYIDNSQQIKYNIYVKNNKSTKIIQVMLIVTRKNNTNNEIINNKI